MQPTYFPWAGYFNLMTKVDYFVFFDDSQFQKSSWHHRNKFLVNGEPRWVTVPVVREFLGQLICNSKLDLQSNWRRKHYELIKHNYQGCQYFSCIESLLEIILDCSILSLSELNISIIKEICNIIGLKIKFLCSSHLGVEGERTNKIIGICDLIGCNEYISPPGAREYLEEDNFLVLTDIKLSFNDFVPRSYEQKNRNSFQGYLSIVDVLANIGPSETHRYISI